MAFEFNKKYYWLDDHNTLKRGELAYTTTTKHSDGHVKVGYVLTTTSRYETTLVQVTTGFKAFNSPEEAFAHADRDA